MLSFIRHSQKLFTPTISRNAFRFSTEVKPAYNLAPEGPYRMEIINKYENIWIGLDPTGTSVVSKPLRSNSTLLNVKNMTGAGRILFQLLFHPASGKYLKADEAGNSLVDSISDASRLMCQDLGSGIFVIDEYGTTRSLTMGSEIGSMLKLAYTGSLFVFHPELAK